MLYSADILNKVTSYGVLGYTVDKIISLVEPGSEADFRTDFFDSNSELHRAYHKGVNTGHYTLDKRMFDAAQDGNSDANKTLHERMRISKVDNLISDRFRL